MKPIMLLAVCAALFTSACEPAGKTGVDEKRLLAAENNAEWLSYGRTYSEQRYSPLDKVNAGNVGTLAWSAEFDTDRGQEATPLIIDGVLYTTTNWSKVYAFDARTGAAKWSFDPKIDKAKGFDACCDTVNRGVAAWNGKIFVGTIDGRLIALDAATGKEVWSQQTTDNSKPYTITGAPRVIKGKVLIGNGGAEYGVRGYISAYDAATGKLAWRFYTTPNPEGKPDGAASDKALAERAAGTWFGDVWKTSGGGGTAWDAMAYDPTLDILYVGTGNGAPWNHKVRSAGKGDNLFLSSIVALKPETGEYVWHYQTTPGDSWDYTATQHIMLADLPIGGETRRVVMQAPKNGFFYVLDAKTGALISAKNYINIGWATGVDPATGKPIEIPAARYDSAPSLHTPGPYGGHNWHPMAFSPKTGLVYIPVIDVPFAYGNDPNFRYTPGAWNTGTAFDLNALPEDRSTFPAVRASLKGRLVAWDPVAQKARWTVEYPNFWNAGVLATAGDLVFQGTADGQFAAYGAADGKPLWSYATTNGVVAAPATYEIDGEQYVAVMVGSGGAGPLSAAAMLPRRPRLPGRLLVFKLGGTAKETPYDIPEEPPLDLAGVTSTGDPKLGFSAYHALCQVCHSPSASGTYLPDLKRSQILLSAEDWKSVVIDGTKADQGMASVKRFLTPAQAEDIRAYVLAEARRPPLAGVVPAKGPAAK